MRISCWCVVGSHVRLGLDPLGWAGRNGGVCFEHDKRSRKGFSECGRRKSVKVVWCSDGGDAKEEKIGDGEIEAAEGVEDARILQERRVDDLNGIWWGGEDSKAGPEWRKVASEIKSYDDLRRIHENVVRAEEQRARDAALKSLRDAGFNDTNDNNSNTDANLNR